MADVVELRKAQHRRIDELLTQAEQAEPEQMAALLRQVADLLLPHSEAEESFVIPAGGLDEMGRVALRVGRVDGRREGLQGRQARREIRQVREGTGLRGPGGGTPARRCDRCNSRMSRQPGFRPSGSVRCEC